MESDTEMSLVKREMSVTTRWIIGGCFGLMLAGSGYYIKESAADIAEKGDDRHDSNIYAHPQAFEKWREFQTAETDRIIQEIRKR